MHSKKEKTGWFFPSIRANVLTNMGTAPGFQQAQKQNKKKTQPTFPSLCSSFWTKKETRFSIILTCKCQPARNQSIYWMLILVEMTLLYVRSMGRRDTGTFSLGTLRKKENRDRHNLKYKTLSFFSFYFRDSIRLSFSLSPLFLCLMATLGHSPPAAKLLLKTWTRLEISRSLWTRVGTSSWREP